MNKKNDYRQINKVASCWSCMHLDYSRAIDLPHNWGCFKDAFETADDSAILVNHVCDLWEGKAEK